MQHIKSNQDYKQKVKLDYDKFVDQVNAIIKDKDDKLDYITKLAENFKKEADKNKKYQSNYIKVNEQLKYKDSRISQLEQELVNYKSDFQQQQSDFEDKIGE